MLIKAYTTLFAVIVYVLTVNPLLGHFTAHFFHNAHWCHTTLWCFHTFDCSASGIHCSTRNPQMSFQAQTAFLEPAVGIMLQTITPCLNIPRDN